MQRLCSLASLTSLIAFLPAIAFSQNKANFAMTHQTATLKGTPSNSPNRAPDRQGQTSSISATSPMIAKSFQISTEIIQSKNDYTSYIVQDDQGKERNLRETFDQTEVSGKLNLDYRHQQTLFSLQRRQSLSESPFYFYSNSISAAYQFNTQLSQVSLQYTTGLSKQPLSYFTDLKTAERRQRPTNIDIKNYALTLDQVVTEQLRSQIQIDLSEKSDRPTSQGITLKSSFAATSRDFFKFKANQASEQTRDKLTDEKGYFALTGYEAQYSRYLTYDLTLNVAYGLLIETEDNPQTLRKDRVATDVYSVKAEYSGDAWTSSISLSSLVSNVDFSSSTVGGQFSWSY